MSDAYTTNRDHRSETERPQDSEPIVVLDDDAALDALPAVTDPAALSSANRLYLSSQGITAPATWAAFRLGQVDAATEARLRPGQRRLTGPGINVPAFDPRHPASPIGIIRLTPAQNKHGFVTAPDGLMAPADIDQRPRVVLCDIPLLTLRLHQEGVADAACVEDPAVIPPLANWFATREVVIVSTKKAGLAAMQAALEAIGVRVAHACIIQAVIERISEKVRRVLGIAPRAIAPRQPIPDAILRDLHPYAVARLSSPEGMAALRALVMDHPDLVRAYDVGYLPVGYRDVLPADVRASFDATCKGNAIVLFARDERGVVVDMVVVKPATNHGTPTVWDAPRGLCGSILATACERLVVTNVPRWIGRLWGMGIPVLLLRGSADAAMNARRLAAGGVRQAIIHARCDETAAGLAEPLRAAGIEVIVRLDDRRRRPGARPPRTAAVEQIEADDAPAVVDPITEDAPLPMPVTPPAIIPEAASPLASPPADPPAELAAMLVRFDPQIEQAVVRYSSGTYTIQTPWDASVTAMLVSVIGTGRAFAGQMVDLAVATQRIRYAAIASLTTGIPPAEIDAALVAILPLVQGLVAPAAQPAPAQADTPAMSDADRAAAMALLMSGQLLATFTQTLAQHRGDGSAADDPVSEFLILAATSRFSTQPLWPALTACIPGERFPAIPAVAAITPPEHLLHVSRLTDAALFHAALDAFRHKLLILDDAAAVGDANATVLGVMRSQGQVRSTVVERDPVLGVMRTRIVAAHGPLAVLTACVGPIPTTLRHHVIAVAVDESPEHAERQLAARRQPTAIDPALTATLWNAQRLLVPRPVVIPAEADLAVPALLAANRPLQDAWFGAITASALLHQFQRMRSGEAVVATAADIAVATRCVGALAAQRAAGLSRHAQQLLTSLWAAHRPVVTVADVRALLPTWTAYACRAGLEELARHHCVAASAGGQGALRTYRLLTGPASAHTGTYDQPGHQPFDLSRPFDGDRKVQTHEVAHG